MNKEDIKKLIGKALEVDAKKIDDNSSSANVDNWDSLGHLSILVALDKKFNGKISSISSFSTADSIEKIVIELRKNKLID
jgi:acyl carrier protein